MLNYEKKVNELITSVYDSIEAKGYSLRDKDHKASHNIDTPITLPKVERYMLSCRCAENLLLSDDVLIKAETTWDKLVMELNNWISNNPTHPKINQMIDFQQMKFDRKEHHTKEITNIITSIITSRPWQVLVGQTIGQKIKSRELGKHFANDNSLDAYLGNALVDLLIKNS
jgi:uncharacterized protein (UPF0297 family)